MDIFGDNPPGTVLIRNYTDPFDLYSRICVRYPHSFLFESLTELGEMAQTSVMGFNPPRIVRGYAGRVELQTGEHIDVIKTQDPMAVLRDMMPHREYDGHRYVGGAVGMVNYDAVQLTEKIPQSHHVPQPLFEFGLYDDGIAYDKDTGRMVYFWYDEDRSHMLDGDDAQWEPFRATTPHSNLDEAAFSRMVDKAKEYIYDGDIFQVVLSRRFSFSASGDPIILYSRLRQLNPSPYMFHLRMSGRTAIGASPEMLVRITGDRVETFPIAGTRRITGNHDEDTQLAEDLRTDPKELAEHTMLVDLGRNDIGRVCKPGTVRPLSLMEVKRFSHVQHMVTHVEGRMDDTQDMFDAFRAIFPAGTVSGAPKVRAMEIIDELEPHARGPYAGAVGYFSANGCCDFAITIRSIFLEGGTGFVQSGAGIVHDSQPSREFEETQEKAGAMLQVIDDGS